MMNVFFRPIHAGLLCMVLSAGSTPGETLPEWPLYNGDFSTFSLSGEIDGTFLETGDPKQYDRFKDLVLPAGWHPETMNGKHLFRKAEPEKSFLPLPYHIFEQWNRPSGAIIDTVNDGRACFAQTLNLWKGKYRISVDVRGTPGAWAALSCTSHEVEFSTGLVEVGESWRTLRVGVSSPGLEATIRLCTQSSEGQSLEFRNVLMRMGSLESAPVPFEDGTELGGIELPEEPSPAEAFAAYELQRVIHKMTGRMPGLAGRDPVHEGRILRIGRAVSADPRDHSQALPEDSYFLGVEGNVIALAGKTDQGTIYAAYDFLKQQGCRWVVPGAEGEIIPARSSLRTVEERLEQPDYDVRGYHVIAQDCYLRSDSASRLSSSTHWEAINLDDYMDWSVRNRLNGIRFGGVRSYDLGAHRGHGWAQLGNHSYNNSVAPYTLHFEEHPEWYPLIDGKRTPKCHLPPFFHNQLCVSNPELRDYTVDLVLDYFKHNPTDKAFPLIPMDGPSLWCECDACKALDPPGIDWLKHASEGRLERMTDRAVNYANEVAERVSRDYPDKKILIQAYSYTLEPPAKETLHPNVLVRYANLSDTRGRGPINVPMMEDNPIWNVWRRQLDRWKDAGARFTYYNYMDFWHPDVSLFWFYSTSDMVRTLHDEYGFRGWFGETEPNKYINFMLFHVMAECLWDVETDYRKVVRDLCEHYYGPVADEMFDYAMRMDAEILAGEEWKEENWSPIYHQDIPPGVLLEEGRTLAEIAGRVRDDPALTRRIAFARLGHAQIQYIQSQRTKTPTAETRDVSRRAFELSNRLREDHHLPITRPGEERLRSFSYPNVEETE